MNDEKNIPMEGPALGLLDMQETNEDKSYSFNPTTFDEYLGQDEVKKKLKVYTKACKMRQEPLDHSLFFGPPGLGKTTIAKVIAKELDVNIKTTSAPIIERSGDLVSMLSNVAINEILFIDEIHRLPKIVEEVLYSAMENFCVDMIVGQGVGAKSIRLPINPFTLIGATTRTSLISGPLQTRFGIVERLDFYEPKDLAEIVMQNSKFFDMQLDHSAALSIGKRARGTPRIVKRLLRRVRDFSQVYGYESIDSKVIEKAMEFLKIDNDGLTDLDRKILTHILTDFDGGPVGIETLAAMTGEEKETLEDFCEPFLIRLGLIQKTPRGRIIPAQKILSLRKRFLNENFETQKGLF
jgi:holliday junction DNA helicase RuvB